LALGEQLLDSIEDEAQKGGYLIDWHACDLFPKSWIDLVVVLRCQDTAILYDRLSARYGHLSTSPSFLVNSEACPSHPTHSNTQSNCILYIETTPKRNSKRISMQRSLVF